MKTTPIITKRLVLACAALALAASLPLTVRAADQVKGGQKLVELHGIKTVADLQALKPGDMIAMACPTCKDVTITYVQPTFKATEPKEKVTTKHMCPGCQTTIEIKGVGKAAQREIVHVCQKCGSKSAFCCTVKKGGAPTKGMEEKK